MSVETQLKHIFRKQELETRAKRRQALLRQMHNELALMDEPLSPDERAINEVVMDELAEADENFRRELHKRFGYWRRLWLAILGR